MYVTMLDYQAASGFFRFRWFFEDKFKHKNAKHIDMFLHKLKDIYINVKWTLSHSKTLWLCLQNHYGNMKEAQLLAFHVKVGDGHMRILGKAYPLRMQQGNHGELDNCEASGTTTLWDFGHVLPKKSHPQKDSAYFTSIIIKCICSAILAGTPGKLKDQPVGAHGIFPQRSGETWNHKVLDGWSRSMGCFLEWRWWP